MLWATDVVVEVRNGIDVEEGCLQDERDHHSRSGWVYCGCANYHCGEAERFEIEIAPDIMARAVERHCELLRCS